MEVQENFSAPGFDTMLDSAFSDAPADTSTATEETAPAGTETSVAGTEEPGTDSSVPAESEASLEPVEGAEAEAAAPVEEGITQDGKGYRVSAPRMQTFRAAQEFYQGISEFAPDVDTARQHYESASDFALLQDDIRNAPYDQEAASKVLNFLDGSDAPDTQTRAAYQQAFVRMAMEMPRRLAAIAPQAFGHMQASLIQQPGMLKQHNPPAFERLQRAMIEDKRDALYLEAKTKGDKTALQVAQNLDFHLTGHYIPDDRLDLIQNDPLAQQRAQIEQQAAALEHQRQQMRDANEQNFASAWHGAQNKISADEQKSVGDLIDKALEQAKGKFAAPQIEAFRRSLRASATDAWDQNQTVKRDYNAELRNIRIEFINRQRGGMRDFTDLNSRITSLVQRRAASAQRVVAREAAQLISAATKDKVSVNQAQHQRLQAAQQKRGVGGGGAPNQRPNVKTLAGNTFDEKFDSIFR